MLREFHRSEGLAVGIVSAVGRFYMLIQTP